MDKSEAEVFKVTVDVGYGDPIVAYVLPEMRRAYVRSMNEEYGTTAKVEPMMLADLPEGVSFD